MWNNRKTYTVLVGVSVGKTALENCNIKDMDTLGLGHSTPRETRVHAIEDMHKNVYSNLFFFCNIKTKTKANFMHILISKGMDE